MSLSKLSERCTECAHKDSCDKKRMVACAYANCAFAPDYASVDASQQLAIKREYRTIKAGDGMAYDIDIEEIKKQLKERFVPFLEFGA